MTAHFTRCLWVGAEERYVPTTLAIEKTAIETFTPTSTRLPGSIAKKFVPAENHAKYCHATYAAPKKGAAQASGFRHPVALPVGKRNAKSSPAKRPTHRSVTRTIWITNPKGIGTVCAIEIEPNHGTIAPIQNK